MTRKTAAKKRPRHRGQKPTARVQQGDKVLPPDTPWNIDYFVLCVDKLCDIVADLDADPEAVDEIRLILRDRFGYDYGE
jgi:hypothetical protein